MQRLILIRHGESNVTVQRVIGGPATCSGLSELGHRQAAALAARLVRTGEIVPDRVVTSTYPRAIETAAAITEALRIPAAEQVYEFGEHFPGPVCDGLSFTEFVARFGSPDWNGNPYDTTFPEGETLAEFNLRIGSALHRLLARNQDGCTMIVCHGGVIDQLLRVLLKTTSTGGFTLYTLNTSITDVVQVEPNLWQLRRYNDSAHLEGLPRETQRPVESDPSDLHELELREIGPHNVADIRRVSVWPSQRRFVASVTDSLIEAHHTPLSAWYRGAYVGSRAIGFVMMAEPPAHPEIPHDDGWYLWRLLIDGGSQRRGYGRRIIELARDHMATRPDTGQNLYVSWKPGSDGPEGFYRQLGFVPTGDVHEGEIIGRLA